MSVALAAALVDTALWLALYLRPTPFGRPFALDPSHYVFHAIYYGAWAQASMALPFVLVAALWPTAMRGRIGRALLAMQIGVTTPLLVLGVIDRECQRFMGMHFSAAWLRTYASVDRTPDVIWTTLATDRGGAWSSMCALALVLAFPALAIFAVRTFRYRWATPRLVAIAAFGLLVLPTVLWNFVPGGTLRQAKVRPALLIAIRESRRAEPQVVDEAARASAIARYQAHQRAQDPTQSWVFADADHPLRKHFVGTMPATPAQRPNFIVLQLETFRAKDMKSMNPALEGPAPTPFLDALAAQPNSAFYRRYYASGVPTVYAFMSIHASILQHPTKSIPYDATHVNIEGFPLALRRHGYHTMHFTGSDPDWDSQRVWLDRWYDEVHFDPAHRERDRLVFRAASTRIREVAREGGPFLAYLSSISNHTPFRSPEPALSPHREDGAIGALHGTMRYTDDVVRELYESLRHEPWFASTIWIITGDHGYDLGDRGEAGGHENLRHETTWVPLIVHGADPRLPRGLQTTVASHVDLAPTIAELASVWDDHSYMGHSLLHRDARSAEALVLRGTNHAFESPTHSLFAPAEGPLFVYAGADLAQTRELAQAPSGVRERAATLANAYRETLTYAVDTDHVAPREPTREGLAQASDAL